MSLLYGTPQKNFSYSLARSAGPIAHVLGSVILGETMALQGATSVPVWGGVTAIISAAALYGLVRTEHTSSDTAPKKVPGTKGKASLVALLAVATNGLIEASHGFHSIATIFWNERGYDPFWCGLPWQTGTAADIFFLWALARWRPAPSLLLVIGASASVVRWVSCAFSPALPALFFLQALHVLSVTACTIATLQLIGSIYEDGDSLPWQVLNWGFSSGLCNGIGRIGSGFLYKWVGLEGYWLMAGLASVGLALGVLFTSE